jgi:phosphomevalonate kinase
MPDPLVIEVDSTDFFSSDGRKAGFGSSAAAAVAIALLTGRSAGLQADELIDFSAEAALAGHRTAQGGRGSGYDVFASLHGGTGIFTGGSKPHWTSIGSLPSFHGVLVPGPAAVRSAEAVSAYRHWLSRQTGPGDLAAAAAANGRAAEAQAIIDTMKASVSKLADATVSGDCSAFRSAMDLAGTAGRQLGEVIGYSAFIAPPQGFQNLRVKALGAGNELGLMILDNPRPDSPAALVPGSLAFRPTGGPQWLS